MLYRKERLQQSSLWQDHTKDIPKKDYTHIDFRWDLRVSKNLTMYDGVEAAIFYIVLFIQLLVY